MKPIASEKIQWSIDKKSNEDALKEKVLDEDLDAVAIVKQKNDTEIYIDYLVKNSSTVDNTPKILQSYIETIHMYTLANSFSIDSSTVSKLISPSEIQIKSLQQNTQNALVPAYLMLILLSISIMTYGVTVSSIVAMEKGNRVMELLVTSTKPLALFVGKTFGVGLAGLTQIEIYGITGGLFYKFGSKSSVSLDGLNIDFSSISGTNIAFLVIFFLLGYFFYSVIFAALGSLVNKTEEMSFVNLPLTRILMFSMLIGILVVQVPDGTLVKVCTYIPFTAPGATFVRIVLSEITMTEVFTSIAVLSAFIFVVGCISAIVFRVGVLMYGKLPTPKQIYLTIKNNGI
ncbi:ABC transporter permease [Clostridium cellulovorans]|uniref:Sodium export permease protein n=1 Tax=Clostridium cellulovorans (strain ATCC 35296 / DSM 3052 / OCM 3 / 743B) TaxID=573061 RepID=D9SVQ3_CLOC7|nr:ABC transporter permease [Clostridium cellulovorans]ADL53114.1 sodium export permease protein [Clostridium cellulovorans 743B]